MPPLPNTKPGPFPAELADRRQWLVWRFVQKPGQKKPSKMPYYATTGMLRGWPLGKPKDGTPTEQHPQVDQGHELDREHLVDHDTAQAFAARHHFDGVGFAFLPGDGLIGIDLDEIDLDETRSARAASIIKACATWCEWSPSGRGVHLIGLGESHTAKSNDIGVELFVGRQFFTMTGNTHPASADDVRPIGAAALEKLHRTIQKAKDDAKPAQPPAPAPGTTAAHNADASRYCLAALESAVQRMRGAGEGTRNDTLNAEVYGLAQLIHTGGISEATIRAALTDAAIAAGLPPGEVTATVRSAIEGGQRNPRVLPERQHQPRPLRPAAPAPAPRQAETVDPETGEILEAPPAANDNAVALSGHDLAAVDWYSPFPDTNAKGKALSTIENVREACRRLGVTVRYNVIAKEIEILIPGEGFSIDNQANASLAWLTSACARFGVPTSQLGDFLCYLADRNPYNPVARWITSKPWDGRSRLQTLFNTIKADGEDDDLSIGDLKEAMLRRWLISAVAAAFEPRGVSAHGVLVLQGEQYLGKTKWFKSLVPAELGVIQDGLMLRPDDRDSVKQAVSYWLVELGELDATFRKSDIAQLKAFITRDRDTLRRAYAKLESHYARRTVFFASVNPRQFLHDPTGNRRYWTISCASIDHEHDLDMQQVWAEVYETAYKAGEGWFLTADELAALNAHNKDHEVLDPIRERLLTRFDWQANDLMWRWMTATDIMLEIGFDKPNRADVTQCGQIVGELNGGKVRKSNGKRQSRVPPRVNA
jgi:hypothetical protein